MTTSTHLPLRRAHVVPVPGIQLSHRRDVVRWALSHGLPLHRDALAAIIDDHASQYDGGSLQPDGPPVALCWTLDDAAAALDVADTWCEHVGARPPAQVARTLLTYLRYLGANHLFAPGSDRPRALRDVALSALTVGEQQRRHPSAVARVRSLPGRHERGTH
ncbi:MAG: hypothetical protein ACKO04_10410 [Actinomycetes bacterium]